MVESDFLCERETLIQIIEDKKNLDALTVLTNDDFADAENKAIFGLLNEMFTEGKDINPTSFAVNNKDALLNINSNLTVASFMKAMVTGDINNRVERLKEKTNIRKIIKLRNKINFSLENDSKAENIFDGIEKELLTFHGTGVARKEIMPQELADVCLEVINERRDKEKRNNKLLFTSYPRFNYTTGGFEKGDLVIISAETGGGKSAFAMNIAYQIGMVQKRPTYYINSEMTTEQMALRWASILSSTIYTKLKIGAITEEEVVPICESLDKVYNSKLYTLTIPDLQIANVLTEIRKSQRKYGIEFVVVDYIGRMDLTNSADKKDWELLKSAAQKLKTLAQELKIVIVMIAQLNANGRLAQSSYMAHEADLWINLTKVEEKEKLKEIEPYNIIAFIKKSRNSESNVALPFYFYGDKLTFIENKEKAAFAKQEESENEKCYGKQMEQYSNSSDNEPTSFDSFAKGSKKNYRRKTY